MTGFGKASLKEDGLSVTAEVKSVNNRYLDVSVRLPHEFIQYEEGIKRIVQKHLKRGKVDLYITIENEAQLQKQVNVDFGLLSSYIHSLESIKNIHNLSTEISIDHVLQLPDIFTISEKETDGPQLENKLMKVSAEAVHDLVLMREREGEVLYKNIKLYINNIEKSVKNIAVQFKKLEPTYKKRLHDKITELLHDKVEIEESRILMEAALIAEKSNIEEELIRLESHCSQLYSTLQEQGPVGRKLDFLVQEMNREINTIGAKGNDLLINQEVINVKSELELIREQIQNIE